MVKTQLEIAHALRKAAAWERDPRNDGERYRFHSARTAGGAYGHGCLPGDPDAVQFCATGRVQRELDCTVLEYAMFFGCFDDELHAIEALHDSQRFADAADLLDGLALLVEETIPVVVTA